MQIPYWSEMGDLAQAVLILAEVIELDTLQPYSSLMRDADALEKNPRATWR